MVYYGVQLVGQGWSKGRIWYRMWGGGGARKKELTKPHEVLKPCKPC